MAVTDQGQTITLALPSTSGANVKTFTTFPTNKFKLIEWTHNSTAPYTVYSDDCKMLLVEWGGATKRINPFTAYGVGTSQT